MSKNNENKLVPKLRFPEFRMDSEWTENELGRLCQYWNGASHESGVCDDGDYFLISLNSIDINGNLKDEIKKISYTDNSLKTNDLVMVLSDVAHGNFLGLSDIIPNDKYVLNQRMAGLRIKDLNEVNPQFIRYYINKSQKYFKSKGQGSSQLNLSKSAVTDFPVLKPPKLKEQQKIAACLSSLDELITAESQKLELLKDHKKGLLQNLLPQAGETVPKFRFKEFEDSGEWVFDTFSEYIKLYRGSSPRPIQNYFTTDDTGVNWIKIGDTKNADNFIIKQVEERITPEGAEKSRKVNVGELILANSMSFGKTYQLAIEGYIYDGWFVLREYEQYFDKQFLLQLLNSDYMQTQYKRLSAGGIVQNISSDIVYKTILPHTSINEQKQIAASLTSLDEFISAQSKKVEALQLHKKGLLQGLFPNLNEVTE